VTPALLAVDLGLKTGWAWFDELGRVVRFRHVTFPNRAGLRHGLQSILRDEPYDPVAVVLEGDPRYARVWLRQVPDVPHLVMGADRWRRQLLAPSDRTSSKEAKRTAGRVARAWIAASGLHRPISLKHDAAEAICIGIWAFRFGGFQRGGLRDYWPLD